MTQALSTVKTMRFQRARFVLALAATALACLVSATAPVMSPSAAASSAAVRTVDLPAGGGNVNWSTVVNLPGVTRCRFESSPRIPHFDGSMSCSSFAGAIFGIWVPGNPDSHARTVTLTMIAEAPTRTKTVTVIVHQPQASKIAPGLVPYSASSVAVAGQPYEFAVYSDQADSAICDMTITPSGTLPPGVTWQRHCGWALLHGTPSATAAGRYPVSIEITQPGYLPRRSMLTLTVSPTASAALPLSATPTLQLPSGLAVPSTVLYGARVNWTLLGNGILGDCVAAATEHMAELFATEAGSSYKPTLLSTLMVYASASGGESGPTVGASPIAAVDYWTSHSLGGQTATGAAQLADPADEQQLAEALWLTGGLLAEVDWPGLGPHEVLVNGVSPRGVSVVTWGSTDLVPWSQWIAPGYLQQVLAVDTSAWATTGTGPSGMPSSQLASLFS